MIAGLWMALAISCDDDDQADCNENVICTEEFRAVTIQVIDSLDRPVLLDSFLTIDLLTSLPIAVNSTTLDGSYPVITDSEIELLKFSGTPLRFLGYLNNVLKVQEDFLVGRDCCHIDYLSGNLVVVINP